MAVETKITKDKIFMTRSSISKYIEQNIFAQRGRFLFNTYIYINISIREPHSRDRIIMQSNNSTETLRMREVAPRINIRTIKSYH